MTNNFYAQGLENAQQGKYQEAIELFTQSLQQNPTFADTYYQRGLAYFDLGQFHPAVWDYGEAIKLDSTHIKAYYARALVRLALKNLPGALEDINQVLKQDIFHASSLELRGNVQKKMNHIIQAIADYKKAADLYINKKNTEGAKRCLEMIKQLQPRPIPKQEELAAKPMGIITEGEYYRQLLNRADKGDYWGAIKDLEWLLKVNPQDDMAYCCRGAIRSHRGDNLAAMSDLNQCLRINPENIIALRNRGKVRLILGEHRGAIADFNQALQMDSKDDLSYMNRGNAYREIGDYNSAIADYTEALKLNNNLASALLNRGMTYARIEEIQSAIDDYQAAATKFCETEDWGNYQLTLEKLRLIQSVYPQIAKNKSINNPLKQRLLILVGGQWAIAERLIGVAKYHYPNMSEEWYLEKVIYDIERDKTN